jgi:hypothetical protein
MHSTHALDLFQTSRFSCAERIKNKRYIFSWNASISLFLMRSAHEKRGVWNRLNITKTWSKNYSMHMLQSYWHVPKVLRASVRARMPDRPVRPCIELSQIYKNIFKLNIKGNSHIVQDERKQISSESPLAWRRLDAAWMQLCLWFKISRNIGVS